MHLNGISMGASHAGPVESFERRSPTSTKRNNLNHGAQRRFRVTGNSGFFFFFGVFFCSSSGAGGHAGGQALVS